MPEQVLLRSCRLYHASAAEGVVDLLIENGRIAAIGRALQEPVPATVIDLQGRILAPGFIDLHVQGAGGADVLDGTEEALQTIARTLVRFGTTAFLATTAMHFDKPNTHLQVAAACTGKDLGGAHLLGLHLEGPFINPQRRGGMSPTCIGPARMDTLRSLLDMTAGALKMMTIAPELDGSLAIIEQLVAAGIVASFGHSTASYEEALGGIGAGITHATHLFNAMAPLHHRQPGPLPALAESDNVTAQLIADGVHVHPAVVKLAWRLFGPSRLACITDGIQALGLPEGRYLYNGREYEAKHGTARYLDGTLIGTALGLDQMVARLRRFCGCSLPEAIEAASFNPAGVLGLAGRKGSLAVGKDADLVVLDPDGSVALTLVAGKVRFRKEESEGADSRAS